MPKTPDEIKKGLECHARPCGCDMGCPYVDVCSEDEGCPMSADALAYIQQLEAERDAAVEVLTKIVQKHDESFCGHCNNWDRYICPPSCRTYCERFNWRGVQKED